MLPSSFSTNTHEHFQGDALIWKMKENFERTVFSRFSDAISDFENVMLKTKQDPDR